MHTVYLVPHTHWDREWYFTSNQSKVLLQETLGVILDCLENGSLPCFVLDGQTSLLEDYLLLVPEDEPRLMMLVRAGRLHIGPWYTQTDQYVVGAESIARNLLYGMLDSQRFGGRMDVGYIPDSFGQTEQLPQILKQFGLERCVFWRGCWEGISPKTEFNWLSRDGSSVRTAVIQHGYSGAKGMPDDADVAETRLRQIDAHVDARLPMTSSDSVLVMAGNDQQPWDPRIPEVLNAANNRQGDREYRLSDFTAFFDALDSADSLANVSGEMLAGKYSRIHRSIYSTRYDIKKANADAEYLVTNTLEPLLVIGQALGIPYPRGLLEHIWKLLLKSHAHDSIGCCNSDDVNRAVKQRLLDAITMANEQLVLRKRQIADRIVAACDGEVVVLFNTLPYQRDVLAEVTIISEDDDPGASHIVARNGELIVAQSLRTTPVHLSELVQDLGAALRPGQSGDPLLYRHELLLAASQIPALGYTTLYLRPGEGTRNSPTSSDDNSIENAHVRVSVEEDGTVTLVDKHSGTSLCGLLEFVDGGDAGDNYDFSPPRQDWLLSSAGQRVTVAASCGVLRSTLRYRFEFNVPADLEQRCRREAGVSLPIEVTLILDRDARRVEVRVVVDNAAREHRLQAVFRTGLDVATSFADQPFGMIERPSRPAELDVWESEGWTSKPVPIYPLQSVTAVTDGKVGLCLMTSGIREYEVDSDTPGDIALTLFRAVGFMGKPDLLYRPGRLSGMPLPTPDSQLQARLTFEFAMRLFDGEPASLVRESKERLTPIGSWQVNEYNKFSINRGPRDFDDEFSALEWQTPLVISAIKKTEQDDTIILRGFNPGTEAVGIGALSNVGSVQRSALDERNGPDDRSDVAPQGVATLRGMLAREAA